ncbi:hypothetical protein CLV58_10277 [Spirosoma oryzae]|uniref:Uncharacterized protein n=1 Tax=Spirosoma oryzae TaxID=1469603 RepID=A0A2T0TI88_9BACT|nr:hypothetical protein CLV58_10277 [Spirosoma oryzae]
MYLSGYILGIVKILLLIKLLYSLYGLYHKFMV